MKHHHRLSFVVLALLALPAARAQDTQRITITGSALARAPSVAGFGGDLPLWRAPFAASVIDQGQLRDAGISGFGDITRLDAGFTDAYNAPGYWNQVAVRGFTLDNRFNYRRDGLPITVSALIGRPSRR